MVGAGAGETWFIQCRRATPRASPACTATSPLTSPVEPWERASGAVSLPLPCSRGEPRLPTECDEPQVQEGMGQRAGEGGGGGHLRSCSESPARHCTRELSLCDAGTPARACPVLRWRISQRSSPKRETKPGVNPPRARVAGAALQPTTPHGQAGPCLCECRARFLASRRAGKQNTNRRRVAGRQPPFSWTCPGSTGDGYRAGWGGEQKIPRRGTGQQPGDPGLAWLSRLQVVRTARPPS